MVSLFTCVNVVFMQDIFGFMRQGVVHYCSLMIPYSLFTTLASDVPEIVDYFDTVLKSTLLVSLFWGVVELLVNLSRKSDQHNSNRG